MSVLEEASSKENKISSVLISQWLPVLFQVGKQTIWPKISKVEDS